MKYRFMDRYCSEFRVERMSKVLGVSRSGYYGWRRRPCSRRQRENEQVLMEIKESHRKSKGTYGSPRVTADIRAKGIPCGKNRVARIMRKNGIVARSRRKFKATTNSKHNLPVAENLLGQKFHTDGPNKIWVSDISYIPTLEGWLYVAVILDVFSRQVVGWGMSDRLTAEFVIRALSQAIGGRRPLSGLIVHSDRGIQYACAAFKAVLSQYGFRQSMSRKGDCYDNALAESFFHTLKTEHVYFHRYTTRAEARQSIFEYIEMFYNRVRRHSSLGYRSPVCFEQEAMVA